MWCSLMVLRTLPSLLLQTPYHVFFTKTSLPKQDPILPEMEFLLVTKTCTRFVVEQVQDEIVRSFVSEMALSIHNTHNKNAVTTSVNVL